MGLQMSERDGGSSFLGGVKLDPLAFFSTASTGLYWSQPATNLRHEPFLEPLYQLAVPSAALGMENLRIHFGWHEEGIGLEVTLLSKALRFSSGNRLDLFLDTRDRKESRALSRFCHHFRYELPQGVCQTWMDGFGCELTRLVGNEQRTMATSEQLPAISKADEKSVTLRCWIPSVALYGFDPDLFAFLGFHLSVCHNKKAHPFSASFLEIDKVLSPSLWTSLRLDRFSN